MNMIVRNSEFLRLVLFYFLKNCKGEKYIKSQAQLKIHTYILNLNNSNLIIVNIDEAVRQQEASYGESNDCPESSQDQ